MAPVYRLKSFEQVGLVEPIKYIFAYGGVPYENVVIKKDITWLELQKTIPFGKLPVLEVDNKVLFQNVSFTWYVAKELGLTSSDTFEDAELGSISLTVQELGEKVVQWYIEEDKYKKEKLETELTEVLFPKYLTDFETIAQKKGGYFGGKKICWSDIYFAGILITVQTLLNKDLLQKQYPMLYQIYRDVHSIPAIKAYVTKYVPNYKY